MDPQIVETFQRLDRVRRWNGQRAKVENAMFTGALVSIILVMVESELLWTHYDTTARWIVKISLSVVSVLLALALIRRYILVTRVQVETAQLPPNSKFYHPSSGLLGWFLCETFLCLFHLPVFARQTQSSPHDGGLARIDQLDTLVLLRVYLLGRYLRNSVGVAALSAPHYVHVIHSFHRVDVASVWFTIKFLFQKHPLLFTSLALVIDWVLTSTALNFLERGVNESLLSAYDAIWLTIVTMTSVGYGEIAPETLGGKLAIALGAIVGGSVIMCLLRVVLIDALLLTPQERLVLDVVHFHQHMRQRKVLAAVLIQRVWHMHRGGRPHNKHRKMRVYVAAEALRLLRFTQSTRKVAVPVSPSSSASTSFSSTSMASKTPEALLAMLHADLETKRVVSLSPFHETAHLLRNISATS